MRTIIKGGVWKNTEDEVLKAAIAKYGKNQWYDIYFAIQSSLTLWQGPNIVFACPQDTKTVQGSVVRMARPFNKEDGMTEDEKLLHLAKLMPTQWRTIAPMVGRTATQCLERYQKLLDEAEAKENEELGLTGPGGEAGPSADDIRRLRPGEIDPDPETKPARPDPIDMDEDEKEMLSEARARLANTQGKKAKRKARERQLEEARRLAVLQKKRELKAAGIICLFTAKPLQYNTDIPFEKKPAPGFYDTSEEQARITSAPVGQSLRRLENKRRTDDDDAERRKRQRRNAENKGNEPHQTKFIAARDAQIQKLKDAESIGRRRKLELPAAQVGETELEEIVKIGQSGEKTKALVTDGSAATAKLIGEYEGLEGARMARTPRTAPQQDNVLTEARNLRNMTIVQTPLLGDENTPLHVGPGGGTGFEGATPRHQVAFTPNPLATPLHIGVGLDGLATPRGVGATPLRTPRDNLSINPTTGMVSGGETPREQRLRADSAKRALKTGFMNLPKPENNFELLVPEDEEEEQTSDPMFEEDAAERDGRLERMREEEEQRILARRSKPVQLGLPRPARVDVVQLLHDLNIGDNDELTDARKLINSELASLLLHDSVAHPLPGTNLPGGTVSTYEIPDDDDLAQAKSQIHLELATAIGFPDATETQLKGGLLTLTNNGEQDESISWAHTRQRLAFDKNAQKWVDPDILTLDERIAGYSTLLDECREQMSKEASKATKMEKKLGITLGGYQARNQALAKRVTDAFGELASGQIDHESFSRLAAHESAAGPRRVETLKEEVEILQRRERLLQEKYGDVQPSRLPDEIFGLLHFVTSPAEAGRVISATGDSHSAQDSAGNVAHALESDVQPGGAVVPDKPVAMAWYALGSITNAGGIPVSGRAPGRFAGWPGGWEERLKVLREEYPLVVFSKVRPMISMLLYSKRAKKLLETYDLSPAPKVIEVDLRADSTHIKTLLIRLTDRSTFPNVILHGRSIGGSDELIRLHEEGRLRDVLEKAGVKVRGTGEGGEGNLV
ncbi:pre-mRNA splicing factor component-domain-containing protein [Boletus reticuloceps]|uniref:Pre-mRNA splicing factor component-domain-containing protein n=1 Tax=Boletus reticuloceps TaxID=495285 RepID=A0A8I3AAB4_9AGAM|nr:pre-mRNA splicing factor component-domain-containing protein [Boletus reticuloceps]